MKVKITCDPITPYGSFSKGQELTSNQYPVVFLNHLIEAGAAYCIETYQTKVVEVEAVKKPQSTQSLPPAKVSDKKTLTSRKKKPKSSR